jgi:hypothetical protein
MMAEFGDGFHSPVFGVNRNREAPLGGLGCVANRGVISGRFGNVAMCLDLAGVFSDLWQGKNLGDFGVSYGHPV